MRADTPGCAHRNHLNNAGSSLMPAPVLAALQDHVRLEAEIGGYEAAAAAAEGVAGAYRSVAALLGTSPDQVAFTEHATASFVAALSAVRFRPGDVLLTTRNDYISNQIQYLALADRFGVDVVRAPDAPEGGVDLQAMEGLIHRRRPRLVAATQIPTNSGLVQDVAAIGRMCRSRDILFLVDACQSVGQMPVDPEAMGCDFLSATARKFLRGPRGAGFLWVSRRALDAGLEPLFPDMRGADWIADDLYQPAPTARRFETWEFAWSLVLATGAAAAYAGALDMNAIQARVRDLAERLRSGLAALDGVRVLDRGRELCAIVTMTAEGHPADALMTSLRERGINTTAQQTGDALLDYEAKGTPGALRLSPHYFNTEAEVDAAVDALREILKR
ncbi:MAG: aminotransferase class V-fold PLP-dependent enzyme [Longimicrobiales bacterium]